MTKTKDGGSLIAIREALTGLGLRAFDLDGYSAFVGEDGHSLVLSVDLDRKGRASKGGKMVLSASSGGFQPVPGTIHRYSLLVGQRNPT